MLEPSEVISLFFHHLKTTSVKAGTVIFREGEKGETMFALMEGEVVLQGEGKIMETIKKHDIFGEGALVQDNHLRYTSAIAQTDCELAELNRERFMFLIQETPLFALEVIRSLSSRSRNLKQKLKEYL